MRGTQLVLLSEKPRPSTPPPELACVVDVIHEGVAGSIAAVKCVQVLFQSKGQHAYGFRISQEQAADLARALNRAAKA